MASLEYDIENTPLSTTPQRMEAENITVADTTKKTTNPTTRQEIPITNPRIPPNNID